MSPISSPAGEAAYALFQATMQSRGEVVQRAQEQRARTEKVVAELIQARIHQTQIAAELRQSGSRIDTYA